MISISVPGSILDIVAARCRATPDVEVCGTILRGEHTPITNISKEPARRFRMHPEEQMEVWNRWKREGDLIVYHSHPRGSAFPSDDDKWVITRSPDVTFIIYNVKCDEFAAYRWNGFAIVNVQIKRGVVSTQSDQRGSLTNGPT